MVNYATVNNVNIGDGVTEHCYSDSHAYTVIAKTAKTITVQRDDAELSEGWKPEIIPGGFVGRCVNQNTQTYTYKPNTENPPVTLRQNKDGFFKCPANKYAFFTLGRHEFYDYNF